MVLRASLWCFLLLLGCASLVGACGGDEGAEALAALQREVDPRAASYMTVVMRAYGKGDYSTALALADSAARHDPALPDAYFYQGLILTDLNRFEEAEAAFEKVLALAPYYRGAWFKLGSGAFLQGKYRRAVAYFRKEQAMLEDSPPAVKAFYEDIDRGASVSILLQLGRSYEKMGVADSARLAYEAALALDSTSATAHGWLSELDEEEGALDEALRHAREAMRLNPAALDYRYTTGTLLYRTGQLEDAVAYLRPIVARRPWHEGANYNLGQALLRLGHDAEAAPYLARAETLQTLQAEVAQAQAAAYQQADRLDRWVELAGLLVQTGQYDEAARAFSAALYLDPMNLALQNDRANLALARGDTAGAIHHFQAILQYDSTFADGWLNLGVVYALSGDLDEARDAWNKALQLEPSHPEARAYLKQLEAQSGPG